MRRRAVRRSGALTFAALSALLLMAPVAGHAAILSVDNAGGYTFTNFDPILTGVAVGSNVNGISNTGRVVGTEVDVDNVSTGANFTGTATNTKSVEHGRRPDRVRDQQRRQRGRRQRDDGVHLAERRRLCSR